jgi:hypothetical protein
VDIHQSSHSVRNNLTNAPQSKSIRVAESFVSPQLTIGFPSPTKSLNISTKPHSTHSSGFSSNALATHSAAVFRTYGLSSFRHRFRGSPRYVKIFSAFKVDMVRMAKARTSGLKSAVSYMTRNCQSTDLTPGSDQLTLTKVLTARMTSSGCVLA